MMTDLHALFDVPRVNLTAIERRLVHLRALAGHYRCLSELFSQTESFDEAMLQEMLAHHRAAGNHFHAILASFEPPAFPTGEY